MNAVPCNQTCQVIKGGMGSIGEGRRSNYLIVIGCLLFIGLLITNTVFAEERQVKERLYVYTLEYPPFCFSKDGEVAGAVTEVVYELMKRIGKTYSIKLLPWKRAYMYLTEEPNVVLFTVTRTKEREPLFKWVGPVITTDLVFFAKKDSKIVIHNLEDAKKVNSIGMVHGYSVEKYLLQKGFTNIDAVSSSEQINLFKLMKSRISLWATVDLVGIYNAKLHNINPAEIKIVYIIKKQEKYIAFSKQVPDEDVQKWQNALVQMKKDGTFQRILNNWLK